MKGGRRREGLGMAREKEDKRERAKISSGEGDERGKIEA